MKDKRADYFACGTLVVWDVDLQSEDVIKSYQESDPDNPVIFRSASTPPTCRRPGHCWRNWRDGEWYESVGVSGA
jgi:hypothetical protein